MNWWAAYFQFELLFPDRVKDHHVRIRQSILIFLSSLAQQGNQRWSQQAKELPTESKFVNVFFEVFVDGAVVAGNPRHQFIEQDQLVFGDSIDDFISMLCTIHKVWNDYKIIIIPGLIVFWPLLLKKWIKARKEKT